MMAQEMKKLVKVLLPCGELMYFDESEWALEGDDNPSYFVNPTVHCALCSFEEKVEHEGKPVCPAEVEHIEMTEEEMKENLVKIDYGS